MEYEFYIYRFGEWVKVDEQEYQEWGRTKAKFRAGKCSASNLSGRKYSGRLE